MQYKELSEPAQAHAFKQFQEYQDSADYKWWENTICDWVIKLERRGIYTSESRMFFRGFGSQGDGACFTGSVNLKEFMEAHPNIRNSHRELYMSTIPFDKHSEDYAEYGVYLTGGIGGDRYCHENTVHIGDWEVDCAEGKTEHFESLLLGAVDGIEEQCREYMRQLYRELEEVHDYEQEYQDSGDYKWGVFLEIAQHQDFNEQGELT